MSEQHSATSTPDSRSFWLSGLEDLISSEFKFLVKVEMIEARTRAEEQISISGPIRFKRRQLSRHATHRVRDGHEVAQQKSLTVRLDETEDMFKAGMSRDEIADAMGLAISTVKMYLSDLRRQGRIPKYGNKQAPAPGGIKKMQTWLVCGLCGFSNQTSPRHLHMRETLEFGPLCQYCRQLKRNEGHELTCVSSGNWK